MELVSNEVEEKYDDLTYIAKTDVENLLGILNNYENLLLKYADDIIKLSKSKEIIDNT